MKKDDEPSRTIPGDNDPIKGLMEDYFSNKTCKTCEDFIYKGTRDLLRESYGDLFDIHKLEDLDFRRSDRLSKVFQRNILAWPRTDELIGHITLGHIEALVSIRKEEAPFPEKLSWALETLLFAAYEYDVIGKGELAKNVYMRTRLACQNILEAAEGYFLRGLLFETIAICQLMLDDPGANESFRQSYEFFEKEDKRIKADGSEEGIEIYYFLEPESSVFAWIDRLFQWKLKPKPSLDEILEPSQVEHLSLKRSLFFIKNTENI